MESNVVSMSKKQTVQWYVVYTRPRWEKKVYQQLLNKKQECYLPTYISLRKWSDRMKRVELPLFPSYLFVRINWSNMLDILQTDGVVRFVYFQNQPAVIKDKEIERIKQFLHETQGYRIRVKQGDHVKISSGELKGYEGVVVKVLKTRVILVIQQLNLSVTAIIPRSQVSPVTLS